MGDKETFTDTGMVSAVTGGPVEGLLYEPRRQTVSRLSAVAEQARMPNEHVRRREMKAPGIGVVARSTA